MLRMKKDRQNIFQCNRRSFLSYGAGGLGYLALAHLLPGAALAATE